MRWIAIVLVFALVIVAMASGGSLMQIVNFPSVVFTFLLGHATLYAVYGKDSFSILSPGFSESQPERAARIARAGDRFYIVAGWVGVLIGAIQMAATLDDVSAFGLSAAVCLLTIYYAYTMYWLVWLPIETLSEENAAEKASG